jgi:alkylhydroperoxidase family enzyme
LINDDDPSDVDVVGGDDDDVVGDEDGSVYCSILLVAATNESIQANQARAPAKRGKRRANATASSSKAALSNARSVCYCYNCVSQMRKAWN